MTPKKPRKSLNDSLASEFVYGFKQSEPDEEFQAAPQAPPASPPPIPLEQPAKTGRKKVEVIRMLLDEALQEIDE